MHKSQSNVTIAMTDFDNLRELNAYAIDIARDYFAMQTIRAEKRPPGKY